MLDVQFAKLHGIGNSFILINDLSNLITEQLRLPQGAGAARIVTLCSKEHGLGCDGLILIKRAEHTNAHFKLLIFNANGSTAEMCGNAVRCVSKYLYDNDYHRASTCHLETPAGLITTELLQHTATTAQVKVNMGHPRLSSKDFIVSAAAPAPPPSPPTKPIPMHSFFFNGLTGYFISLGNPHAIIPVANYSFAYLSYARKLQQHKQLFPFGVNVSFITNFSHVPPSITNGTCAGSATLRVIERGVGETAACGTAACAAASFLAFYQTFACDLPAQTAPPATFLYKIMLPGGELDINWTFSAPLPTSSLPQPLPSITLSGEAVTIATGTIKL